MQFTTMLQVPNTRGGILAKNLIKAEPDLARITGYNVKVVEKAGIQLCRLFQRVFTPDRCHWDNCPTCLHSTSKGDSGCRKSNIVYEAACMECEQQSSDHEKGAFNMPVSDTDAINGDHENGASTYTTWLEVRHKRMITRVIERN